MTVVTAEADRRGISSGSRRLHLGVVATWAALAGLLLWSAASGPHERSVTLAAWAFVVATGALVAGLVERDRRARRLHDAVVAEERRARLGGEHARRQLAFLAAASGILARSVDEPVPMLRELLGILVPEFADVSAVDLLSDGVLTRVASTPDLAAGSGRDLIDRVLATGEPVLVKDVDATGGDCLLPDDVVTRFAEELGLASAMVVPIRVRGLSIGALTVGTHSGRRGFRPSDLAAAEDLASRMAIAIERSLLFGESESRAAQAAAQAAQLRRLMEAASAVNSRLSVRDVATVVADQARSVLDAAAAQLTLESLGGHGPHDPLEVTTPDDWVGTGDEEVLELDLTSPDGACIGRLGVVRSAGHTPSAADWSALASLAQMTSVALENARLYDQAAQDERHLQSLLDATPVALVEVDAEGRSTRWNPAASRLFGWEVEAESPSLPGAVAQASAPVGLGRPVVDVPVNLADEVRDLALSVSAVPLSGADGPSSALVVVSDLTERREVERQLGQAQRLEAMARVAGAVAHDFNNLLTVVVGYSELLLRQRRSADLVEPLEAIRRAGSRASELTLQLLTISRRDVVERVAVDVDEVIGELEPVLQRIAGDSVELGLDLGTGGARVLGDRGQLEQVVLNLVMNARDAMPAGGTITIDTSLVGEGEQPRVRLLVQDTGVGMDEETAAHCFEPFFTTKARTKGTGLGLSTAHATIVQAGGTMTARSRPGVGTTFESELPVTTAHPTVPATTDADPRASSGRVLLVEDDDDVRNLVDDVLQLTGYEVMAFTAAADALEALGALDIRPDVVVTDVVMSGMDGMELARRLREGWPDLPVLIISGYADAAPAPLDDLTTFLAKPFTEATLTAAVRAATTGQVGQLLDHDVPDQGGSKR